MSDLTTIARPYAKALFEYARDNQQLAVWSDVLKRLAQVVLDAVASEFISDPSSTIEQQCQLLGTVSDSKTFPSVQKEVSNFISLLAHNKRLMALPDVCAQYEALRAKQEKTLVVEVRSYAELSNDQQNHLIQSLNNRLKRQVTLNVHIDKSLLGGAIIQAGDLVIDGSVRGKLNKLRSDLAA
jgi:F-type H+-transporting ATPase subunit delta